MTPATERSESAWDREHRRIADAYARREAAETSGAAYFGYEDPAHLVRQHDRYRRTLTMLAETGLTDFSDRRVLDVGCGDGDGLLEFVRWGVEPASLCGVDLRASAIERADRRVPGADLRVGCGSRLPFESDTFDVVQQSTVLSSILDQPLRASLAGEMLRVVRPGGFIVSYDTRRRNPSNPDVAPVDEPDLRALFPRTFGTIRAVTFLPHVARRLPPRLLEWSYPLLTAIRPCCSHLLAVLVKKAPSAGPRTLEEETS